VQAKVTHARDWLDERGTQCNTDGMPRYGIVAPRYTAFPWRQWWARQIVR